MAELQGKEEIYSEIIGDQPKLEPIILTDIETIENDEPMFKNRSTNGLRFVNNANPGMVEVKYGVNIPDPERMEAKYGVNITNPDINITYNQLEENIAFLKKAISDLKQSWNETTKNNLTTINNSWAGADCAAYTAKLTNMDNKVQKTISSLELLCTTYEKARDMVQEKQNSIISSINNS